jgi:protoporphyrinogen oxidase
VSTIAILGSGMAAFGAGHTLAAAGRPFTAFDSADRIGGHTSSRRLAGGWVFDDGPHVSFTRDERIQSILADAVDQRFEIVQMHINNYWHGHWMKHPVQCNLHGLPSDLVVDIIRDFVAVQGLPTDEPPRTYAEWLEQAYGTTFAQTFPMVYGPKYHTTSPANLTTEWLGPRMYRPNLEEVLRGALETTTADIHYVTHFRYPTEGGFVSYLRPFWDANPPQLGHELVELDPVRRRLRFANGVSVEYDGVISSIGLPDLIPLIQGAPAEVREAAGRLAWTSAVIVDIGVDRADLSPAHLSYFYDEDIIFTRLNFPHMLSPRTVPDGHGSIQAEVYFSEKYRPFDTTLEAVADRVIADARRVGVLHDGDRVVVRDAHLTRYANIIYDLERAAALDVVHGYLREIGVRYCGRYGDWDHAWTDEAFTSGAAAATGLLR